LATGIRHKKRPPACHKAATLYNGDSNACEAAQKEPDVPIMEWQEKYNLGIDQFDVHHQHLAVLLNSTYDNFVGGFADSELGLVLDALVAYAIYHFNAEERWMKEQGYGKLEEHLEMHSQFKTRVAEIQTAFLQGKKDAALETLTLLSSWLSNHILVADAELAPLLSGIQPPPRQKSSSAP
jgi:hemerythrin